MPRKPVHKRVAYGLPPSEEARLESFFGIQKAFAGAVNPDGSLKPVAIKALFERFQINFKAFAGGLGVSDAFLHAVIARRKRNVRVENAIAERLGFDPHRLWGRSPLDAA